jgi:hypothetical protein
VGEKGPATELWLRGGGAVVFEWCLGGGFLDMREFGRRQNGDGGEKRCTVRCEMRGKRNSDLKRGLVRVQITCDRSYVSAFDRIRAEGV